MATNPAPRSRRLLLTTPGEKLLVSSIFNSSDALDTLDFHPFTTTGEIKIKLDSEMAEWVAPKVVYALLANGEKFWVDISDDRKCHGGCAVVKTVHFDDDIRHPLGYTDDKTVSTTEWEMKKLRIEVDPGVTGTPVLRRYDTHGSIWSRRRYALQGDDTYTFVQWMDTKSLKLKEKPVSTKLTDVADHVKSLDDSYKILKNDISEMKTLVKSCSTLSDAALALAQSLKEIVKEQTATTSSLAQQVSQLSTNLRRET